MSQLYDATVLSLILAGRRVFHRDIQLTADIGKGFIVIQSIETFSQLEVFLFSLVDPSHGLDVPEHIEKEKKLIIIC